MRKGSYDTKFILCGLLMFIFNIFFNPLELWSFSKFGIFCFWDFFFLWYLLLLVFVQILKCPSLISGRVGFFKTINFTLSPGWGFFAETAPYCLYIFVISNFFSAVYSSSECIFCCGLSYFDIWTEGKWVARCLEWRR